MGTWRVRVARTTGNLLVETVPAAERIAVVDPRTRKILFLRDNRDAAAVRAATGGYV